MLENEMLNQSEQDNKTSREKLLERKIEQLRLEVAYLKS